MPRTRDFRFKITNLHSRNVCYLRVLDGEVQLRAKTNMPLCLSAITARPIPPLLWVLGDCDSAGEVLNTLITNLGDYEVTDMNSTQATYDPEA